MARIFLSHSHHDNASAVAVGQWLSAQGWNDFFLDIAADRGLTPGERWQEALKRAADRCQAVLFLISDDWLESRWCLAEFLLAKQLGKAIFGVMVRPTPLDRLPPEMRNEWQLCDLVGGAEHQAFRVRIEPSPEEIEIRFAVSGLGRLRHGIKRAGLDPSTFQWPPVTDSDRAPYSGLRAMDREDAAVFFGRDAPITLALDSLRRLRESGPERLFVILGASGSGKSSFLRAGLLPRLERDDRHFFVTPVIRPERAAMSGPNGLLGALDRAFRAVDAPVNRAALRHKTASPGEFARLVAALRQSAYARLGTNVAAAPSVVFPIDQAEELFSAEHREEADQLLGLLQAILAPSAQADDTGAATGAFALVSIRSDSYERLQTAPLLTSVRQHIFSLPPVPREEYKSIIEGPAERHRAAGHRLDIDPSLTQKLLEDTQGADALPLLAFTLERLFVEHGADGVLSADDYKDLGGVEGSIEAAVKAALIDPSREPVIPADEREQERLLKMAFIPWLAQVDAETEERKRRVATWEEIPAASHGVIERLLEQRLLIRDRRRVPGAALDAVVVEVAHEALLRRWPMLTLWLAQDADALKAIDLARRAAAEWMKHGQRTAWLNHTTERLSVVESLQDRADLDRLLGEDGRAYLRACRKRDDEAAAAAQTRERERLENEQRVREAEQAAERDRLRVAEAQAAQASERAASARTILKRTVIGAGVAVALAIVAGVAAWNARTQQREAEHALGTLNASEASRKLVAGQVAEGVAHLSEAVRLVPDESVWRASLVSTLLANRWSRTTVDVRTDDPARAVVFSPVGRLVLVAAGDEARLWDAATGQAVGTPMRHRNLVEDARFSADGNLVVTASRDRTARVWDGRTGAPQGDPIPHDAQVTRAMLFADGRRLLTVAGGRIRVIDRTSGSALSAGDRFHASDGRFVVSDGDNRYKLWNLESATATPLNLELSGGLDGTRFSADGRYLAVWSYDTVVTIDTRSGRALGPAIRLEASISGAEPTADGSRVLISTYSGENRLVHSLRDVPSGQTVAFAAIDTAPSASGICALEVQAVGTGNRVSLRDPKTGRERIALINHASPVQTVGFSRNCQQGFSIGGREVRVWDPRTGAVVAQPLIHATTVTGATFSADGRYLATLSAEGARVWDLRTGHATGEPLKHPVDYDMIAFSGNGERAVTVQGQQLQAWDARADKAAGARITLDIKATSVAISPDGEQILVEGSRDEDGDASTIVFKASTGEKIGGPWRMGPAYIPQAPPVTSPDWSLIVIAREKAAQIRQLGSGERQGKLLVHRQPITAVSFSRDGALIVTASEDTTARVWASNTGEPMGTPLRHEQAVRRAVFSADGSRIVTLFDRILSDGQNSYGVPRQVRVWNSRSGAAIGGPISHDEDVTALAISPDGSRILTATRQQGQLWDPATGARVGNAIEFPEAIGHAVYSLDGTRIVTTAGNTTYLWDAERLSPIGQPMISKGRVVRAQLTADDQRLLIVTSPPLPPAESGMSRDCAPEPCRQSAALWDVPTVTAGDAPVITRVAEILAGYRISTLGAVEPVGARAQAAAALLAEIDATATPNAAQRIARWLLVNPEERTTSPLAAPSQPVQKAHAQVR